MQRFEPHKAPGCAVEARKPQPSVLDSPMSSRNATKSKEKPAMDVKEAKARRKAALDTPTNLTSNATTDISGALNALLADMFALYLKTKNFHWHMSGPHFRDYHLLLDEHGEQIFGTTDDIAERVRKIGGTTLRSIGHIARLQRIADNDADFVSPQDMLAELRDDNKDLTQRMREVHDLCDEHGDVATASLLENWIDEAERRVWFLFEAGRNI
jgi:starvation-inducible DNA-binding protein